MNVRTLCLAILSKGDATGYEIRKQSVDGQFSHFVDASFGSIYPALARLEADGMVTWREEAQAGKPARKTYSITNAGRAEFAASLLDPPKPDIFRSEFLLVAMFAELAGPDVINRAIDLRIEQLEQECAHLASINAQTESPSVRWVTAYGVECMGRSLAYLHENREHLLAISVGPSIIDADAAHNTPAAE